jgi:amidase
MEHGIIKICLDSLETALQPLGHKVEQPLEALFSLERLWHSWTTIRSAVVTEIELGLHDQATILKTGAVREELQWEIGRGLRLSDEDLQTAGDLAQEWSEKLNAVFDEFDAIALPSAQCWPFPATWKYPEEIAGRRMDTYHRWMEVVVPVSLAGLPCVTVPAGFGGDSGKLSIGIQLAGQRGNDSKLLELAQFYHSATGWPAARPPPTCS